MTIDFEIPDFSFSGNGVQDTFAYVFASVEQKDVNVHVDNVLQIEFSDYTIINYDENNGGDVLFEIPPATGTTVRVFRKTPITQQTDYLDMTPFPAETHEDGADKIIMIIQEFITGLVGFADIDLDLFVTVQANTVTVVNNAGTDAVLPAWHITNDEAGVFHGEVNTSIPANGEPSSKPDGYIYLEVDA